MKTYRLTVITENQNQLHKAEKLAQLIKSALQLQSDPEISKSEKFENSYRIAFAGKFHSASNYIAAAVELTDIFASPWLISYERETGDVELVFNKSAFSKYGRQEFSVMRWANLETA